MEIALQKKSRWVSLALILIILMVVGCKMRSPAEAERIVEDIHKGTQGLVMSFAKGMPPDKIYDTSTLDLLIELRNKGTSDLEGTGPNKGCMLYLSGYDKSIILFDKEEYPCGNLDGRSVFNPEGGMGAVEFNADTIILPYGVDSYEPNLLITACYKYKTVATPVVCVDPHLYEISPVQRACAVSDVSMSGGQGAPVAVDRVDVDMMKNDVLFKIHISNKGRPTVTKKGLLGRRTTTSGRAGIVLDDSVSPAYDCPYRLDYDDYNIVTYRVDAGTISLVECTPRIQGTNKVRLIDNKATIYCKFDISALETATQIPLTIELYYGYMDYISKKVEIIRTP